MTQLTADTPAAPARRRRTALREWVRRNPTMAVGGVLLAAVLGVALFAPWLGTVDPLNINPIGQSTTGP